MSKVDRLEFSKPPPGYEVRESTVWVGWVWQLGDEVSRPARESEDAALRSAWAHYKARHDPPGMWSGYCAVLPLCDQFRPRMGVSIPGVAHLELYVNAERPGTCEDAKAMGRAAAWDHYVDAVELADKLDRFDPRKVVGWSPTTIWPRALAWVAEERDAIRHWLVDPTVGLPEVLRGI